MAAEELRELSKKVDILIKRGTKRKTPDDDEDNSPPAKMPRMVYGDEKRYMNQLFAEMDGFPDHRNVQQKIKERFGYERSMRTIYNRYYIWKHGVVRIPFLEEELAYLYDVFSKGIGEFSWHSLAKDLDDKFHQGFRGGEHIRGKYNWWKHKQHLT